MKIAAIDIGSNACRLLINEVKTLDDNSVEFIKTNLIRVPLRLGIEVFSTGRISPKKYKMFEDSMNAFAHLMNAYGVQHYKAYATSAMRDAENGTQIANKLLRNTGIHIEIIDGLKEASLLNSQLSDWIPHSDKDQTILIDVGGGSTEITSYINREVTHQKSFNIGTIRLLNGQVGKEDWASLAQFCQALLKKKAGIKVIGTGGNINKVFSMSKAKDNTSMSVAVVEKFYKILSKLSVEERMHQFNLRDDRADVIVPALCLYLYIMKELKSPEIFVPKLGLSDGIIREIYQELTG